MNIVIETDRSIVHDAFYVHYVAQKVMIYILQFNENTKHKFMRLYCCILLPVCFWRTNWPFMTSFCVGILYKCTHLGLSRKCLFFKLRNAPNCTDLHRYFHKFPGGGDTPGPQNWEGGKPTSYRRARPPFHLLKACAAAAPIKSPNMQRDFTNPSYILLYFLVSLSLTASFHSALKHTYNRI